MIFLGGGEGYVSLLRCTRVFFGGGAGFDNTFSKTRAGNIYIAKSYDQLSITTLFNISSLIPFQTFLAHIKGCIFGPRPTTNLYDKLSFSTGIFSQKWKVANIVPLQKSGDPTDVNNLRSISLLPLPGKIIERVVYIHNYLSTWNTANY